MINRSSLLLLCSAWLLSSCSEEEIRTYRVAADDAVEATTAKPDPGTPQPLRWQAPEAWKEESPGQFQKALYRLSPDAHVSVSSLPGDAGGEAANLSRWRGQIGLDPDSESDGKTIVSEGESTQAKFHELIGEKESILAAIISLESETWFFKLTAPTDELEGLREGFIAFLQTIQVGSRPAAATDRPSSSPEKPAMEFQTPDGWEMSEGSAMRVASFRIPGKDGPDADVSVIPLFGNSGSLLENVNRWRSQLRLPPLESEDDPALGKKLDGRSGSFTILHMVSEVAMHGGDRRGATSVAVLEAGDATWFFKLTGEAELVQENREKFEAFVRSAQIP